MKAIPHNEYHLMQILSENETFSEKGDAFLESDAFAMKIFEWCALCSIRNTPDQAQVTFLMGFFKQQGRNLSAPEVEFLLMHNMTGEYWEPVEHFQSFSVSFLSTITFRYNKFRVAVEKKLEELKFKAQKQEPKPVPSKGQTFWDASHTVFLYYKDFIAEKPIASYTLAYEFLVKVGLLIVSESELEAAKVKAWNRISERQATSTDRSELKKIADMLSDISATEKLTARDAKEILVKNHWYEASKVLKEQGIKYGPQVQEATQRYMDTHLDEFTD